MGWNGCVFFKKRKPLIISGSKCTLFTFQQSVEHDFCAA